MIYGEINQKVQKNIYTGGSTATATVYVDNATNTIYANTKVINETEQLRIEIAQLKEELKNLKLIVAELKK